MTGPGRRVALVILILATVGCDRVTKDYAIEHLAGTPGQSLLADTVRLTYVENPGGFLSLGSEWPSETRFVVFIVGTGVLLLVACLAAARLRWSAPATAAFTLAVSGGVSNVIDRIMRGSVVDFLNVGIGPLRTGIFNVADVAIMAGAALFLFASTRSRPGSDDMVKR